MHLPTSWQQTPRIQEGPYYPTKLPLDTDNDLLIINDAITPAVGEVTHLSGRILDTKGDPIQGAVVEIWQCDRDGTYLKPHLDNGDKYDTNFQGFGRFLTGLDRRVLLPDDQAGAVHRPAGGPHPLQDPQEPQGGADDRVLRQGIREQRKGRDLPPGDRDRGRQEARGRFRAVKGSRIGELAATFDVVLGTEKRFASRIRTPRR